MFAVKERKKERKNERKKVSSMIDVKCAVSMLWSDNMIAEPLRRKTYLLRCAPSEYSDQPAHSRSLIRIFTGRIFNSQGCKVSSCEQRRLRSDCADAQADLSLRWAHTSDGTFSRFANHIYADIMNEDFYCLSMHAHIILCPDIK